MKAAPLGKLPRNWKKLVAAGINLVLLGLLALLVMQFLSQARREKVEAFEQKRHVIIQLVDSKTATPLTPPEGQPPAEAAATLEGTPSPDKPAEPAAPEDRPEAAAPEQEGTPRSTEELITALPPPPKGLAGLKEAPNPVLIEEVKEGKIPRLGSDGTAAWKYYGRDGSTPSDGGAIAILVTGVGINQKLGEVVLRLPPDISFSISPYAPGAGAWNTAARARGHETFIDLPIQAGAYPDTDPGPLGIVTDVPQKEVMQRLYKVMAKFTGYVGVTVPAQERYTRAAGSSASDVWKAVHMRGLMAVLPDASPEAPLEALLHTLRTPRVAADVAVRDDALPEEVTNQLIGATALARRQGLVLVTIPARPVTLNALAEWLETLEKEGVVLVPVSLLARKRFS